MRNSSLSVRTHALSPQLDYKCLQCLLLSLAGTQAHMWQFFSKECIKCEVNSNTDQEARISAGPTRLWTAVIQLGAEYFTPFILPTGQPGWASEDAGSHR